MKVFVGNGGEPMLRYNELEEPLYRFVVVTLLYATISSPLIF